jgi:nicotinate phosphoribosyltransferase
MPLKRVGGLLLTDSYELRMAASYLRRGMDGMATFSLFVRRLPPERGFLVAAGLEDCLSFLAGFGADRAARVYLAGVAGLTPADRRALARLRFTGDVWAVPEGRIVFENEPLLEVTAPIAEAQVVETYLLNQVTFQTAIASKAARCRLASGGRTLIDFGFRRTHGAEAAMALARLSAIAGFSATSNVAAAQQYELATSGTMAHSYIEAFEDEHEAFRAFAEDFPDHPTFLVDTYDTELGVASAIRAAKERGLGDAFSVRLDSGDLDALARQVRRQLDEAGCPSAQIVASGGLDEYDIATLVQGGAPVDAFGVGTKMAVSADAPSLESAYKLVAYAGRPVLKLSAGKASLPGAKQVFRNLRLGGDVLGLREEDIAGREPLLVPVMLAGERIMERESVVTLRDRLTTDIDTLPESARRLQSPEPMPVVVSQQLDHLRLECVARVTRRARPAPPEVTGIASTDDPRIAACTTEVALRDGTRIRIRPIVTADKGAIVRGFERLSTESRVRRFFNPPASLSESMLHYLTTIDYTNHMALGAWDVGAPDHPGVAIARYIRLIDEPECAEAAVTVIDEYQHRGIATVLLEALALIAVQNGINRFCGYVQWENDEVLRLVRGLGGTVRHSSTGVARLDVPLEIAEPHSDETPLLAALRLLARHEIDLVSGGADVSGDPESTAGLVAGR